MRRFGCSRIAQQNQALAVQSLDEVLVVDPEVLSAPTR